MRSSTVVKSEHKQEVSTVVKAEYKQEGLLLLELNLNKNFYCR
jgi:hypothetical protein